MIVVLLVQLPSTTRTDNHDNSMIEFGFQSTEFEISISLIPYKCFSHRRRQLLAACLMTYITNKVCMYVQKMFRVEKVHDVPTKDMC